MWGGVAARSFLVFQHFPPPPSLDFCIEPLLPWCSLSGAFSRQKQKGGTCSAAQFVVIGITNEVVGPNPYAQERNDKLFLAYSRLVQNKTAAVW